MNCLWISYERWGPYVNSMKLLCVLARNARDPHSTKLFSRSRNKLLSKIDAVLVTEEFIYTPTV